MKKSVFTALVAVLLTGIIFSGCNQLTNSDAPEPSTKDLITKIEGTVTDVITTTYKRLVKISARAASLGDAPEGWEWQDVERKIYSITLNDGKILDVYSDEEKMEDGYTYIVLSEYKSAKIDERTTAKFSIEEYGYNLCLYEVVNFEDNTTAKLAAGTIVRNYPSLNLWTWEDGLLEYFGKTLSLNDFKNVLSGYGFDYANPDENWWAYGWSTKDEATNTWPCHQIQSMRFSPKITDKMLEDNGIEKDEKGYYVYKKVNQPETGKKYIKLNQYKKTEPESSGHSYGVFLFEICTKEDADTVEYKKGETVLYIRTYPSANLKVQTEDSKLIGYGEEITFDKIETLFGGFTPDIQNSWVCWGWSTYNKALKVWVSNKAVAYDFIPITTN